MLTERVRSSSNNTHQSPQQRIFLFNIRNLNSAAKDDDYSVTFKELICVAASDLSALIQVPFENIGMLYRSIIRTGTLKKHAKWMQPQAMLKPKKLDKAKRGQSSTVFGRGQLLFLVRRVDRFESARLLAVGHRLTSIANVVDFLARSTEITREELMPRMGHMRDNSEKSISWNLALT